MMDNPITRTEYEKRHDELALGFRAQIARLDSRIDKAESSDQLLKTQMDAKFDKVFEKIETSEKLLSKDIGSLKDSINRSSQAALWRVLGWLISFILGGGGVITALQAFHLLR